MKTLTLAALVLMSTALSGSAFARIFTYSATVCQPVSGATTSVDYSNFGINNTSASPVTIECPLPMSYNQNAVPSIGFVNAVAYDRSTTSDVTCSFEQVDPSGNVLLSDPRHTSNGGPGSGAQTLSFLNAFGASLSNSYFRLRCTLPGVQSGALSHLTTITVGDNE